MGTADYYSGLVTSQHRDKPRFMAALAALLEPFATNQAVLASLPGLHDLDAAAGDQLDACGTWVGLPRTVSVPSLGTVTLADADYRTLLRARVLRDHWDGSMDSLQAILGALFPGTGITLFSVDGQDMSITIYVTGGALTPTELALLKGGLLVPKPEGVRIAGIAVVTGPLFGLDREDSSISGPDVGAFVSFL